MPSTNYALNRKQLELLRLFYRFRFVTSYHLATTLGLRRDTINQRLQTLLDQDYIGRRYDGQYKIHGRLAEYYLLISGIAALKQHMPDKCDGRALHAIYRDRIAKPSSIAHYLNVFTVYCRLKERYGNDLRFFTKSQITSYGYFPEQKPAALIRLDVEGERKEFFLEVIDPSKRFFTHIGKVRRYIEYADTDEWSNGAGTKLPKILVVGDSVGLEIRFQRQAARFLKKHYEEEPKMYTSNLDKLKEGTQKVWRDVEEPGRVVSLDEI